MVWRRAPWITWIARKNGQVGHRANYAYNIPGGKNERWKLFYFRYIMRRQGYLEKTII